MDDADRAKEAEQMPIDLAIAAARAATAVLSPVGICYHCDAIVPPGCRFCDADCRDDHERQQRADKIAGRRQ
jgi:hypothetical protein